MLYWLAYRQRSDACVVIIEASSLISARMKSALAHDIEAHFTEGHLLPDGFKVSPSLIGKVLTGEQARGLLG